MQLVNEDYEARQSEAAIICRNCCFVLTKNILHVSRAVVFATIHRIHLQLSGVSDRQS